MASMRCIRCGSDTNSALCDWADIDEDFTPTANLATRCYARWDKDDKCWVEGCAINDSDADDFSVKFAKHIIQLGKNDGN